MADSAIRDSMTEEASVYELPGWGHAKRILDLDSQRGSITRLDTPAPHKLGEWKATAICGNDITSSCLYVVALSALYAGPLAPFALLAVAGVLYLFRNIYTEVGTALPLNGGAYNVLLNTTTKSKASIAACLTLLSYIATAVISANTAMHYASNPVDGLNVFWATVAVLGLFAVINLVGINESATVALGIFAIHLVTMAMLAAASAGAILGDPSTFLQNWRMPTPKGVATSLFFGFSVAMLGISGFESSANFIEEQQEGVFPKTLRNMWIAVAVLNPLLSVLAMGLLPLDRIGTHQEDLLAEMGFAASGTWLQWWVSFDAVLVLSGAVLTCYVGVIGLVRRMALDRCLPQFFLAQNRRFRTNHWIIVLFFFLCYSILMISHGHVMILAGVYTLSFLSVMALFAVGNMLLKTKRAELPRAVRASWGSVTLALFAVCLAIAGNVHLNPKYVEIFVAYFLVAVAAVTVMFMRVQILKVGLIVSKAVVGKIIEFNRHVTEWVIHQVRRINEQSVIFFTKGDDITELNNAALYVLNNEQAKRLTVVRCYEEESEIPSQLAANLKILHRIYPRLRLDLVLVKGRFGPELIERLSRRLGVPKNYMFIGTPDDRFPHKLAALGGVRLIM
jgi:amino acid transporter